jgi:hypothetical protein
MLIVIFISDFVISTEGPQSGPKRRHEGAVAKSIKKDFSTPLRYARNDTNKRTDYTQMALYLTMALEVPGASHGAAQHSVGLFVVDELLFFRVPAELSAQPYGNVVQVADGVGADGGVNGTDCLPSALDAFYEIPAVITASRQTNLIGTNRGG